MNQAPSVMKHHTRNKPSTACDGCKDSGCDVLSVILFCLSTNHSHINPYPFYISFTCDNNLSEDPPPWRWKVKLKLGRIIWYPYLQPWNHHPMWTKRKRHIKNKEKIPQIHAQIHTHINLFPGSIYAFYPYQAFPTYVLFKPVILAL